MDDNLINPVGRLWVGVDLLVFLFFTLGRYRDREKPPTQTAFPSNPMG